MFQRLNVHQMNSPTQINNKWVENIASWQNKYVQAFASFLGNVLLLMLLLLLLIGFVYVVYLIIIIFL